MACAAYPYSTCRMSHVFPFFMNRVSWIIFDHVHVTVFPHLDNISALTISAQAIGKRLQSDLAFRSINPSLIRDEDDDVIFDAIFMPFWCRGICLETAICVCFLWNQFHPKSIALRTAETGAFWPGGALWSVGCWHAQGLQMVIRGIRTGWVLSWGSSTGRCTDVAMLLGWSVEFLR